jgi:6-phosphofructokinase 2
MLKKALQEESISFEAIETRGGHRKISLQLMTTNSQFRLFSVTTRTIAEKDKIISTIQELEFNYLIVSGGLSEVCLWIFINK